VSIRVGDCAADGVGLTTKQYCAHASSGERILSIATNKRSDRRILEGGSM
jgi:hypothetical protein